MYVVFIPKSACFNSVIIIELHNSWYCNTSFQHLNKLLCHCMKQCWAQLCSVATFGRDLHFFNLKREDNPSNGDPSSIVEHVLATTIVLWLVSSVGKPGVTLGTQEWVDCIEYQAVLCSTWYRIYHII